MSTATTRAGRAGVAALTLTILGHAAPLLAQATTSGAAESAAARDVAPPGGVLMLVSYLVLWALLLGFVVALVLRQRRLEGELEALERRIDAMAHGEARR